MSKKLISRVSFLICFFIVFSCGITFSNAQASQITIILNGQQLVYDDSTGYPYYDSNGRMQVPLRATLEPLGATVSVNSKKNSVIVVKDDIIIEVPFGKPYIYKNGEILINDTISSVKDNKTYLPIRIVLEALGYSLTFNSKTNTLSIDNVRTDSSNSITIWHYYKYEADNIKKALTKKFPETKIYLTVTPDTQLNYQNKLAAAYRANSGMPDLFALESAFIKRFIDVDGLCENLGLDKYKAADITSNMFPFTLDIAKDYEGNLKGLSWYACPGGVGYKRDIAKKYLGTDDPDKIENMLSSPENIIGTAKTLYNNSKGTAKLFPGHEDLFQLYSCARSQPWIVNNKLTIDSKMIECLDLQKYLFKNKYSGDIRAWTPYWNKSISDRTTMCFAIPTWGISNIIEANDKSNLNKGMWGIAKAPYNYYWGGTVLCMSATSDKKDLSWQFMKYLTSDKDHLEECAQNYGYFINNKELVSKFKNDDTYINKTINQNIFKVYEPIANDINATTATGLDDIINNDWLNISEYYFNDRKTKEKALADFSFKVFEDIPYIDIF